MKKIILTFVLMLFALSAFQTSQNANAYQIKADAQTKRIPMGTKFSLEAANTVTTAALNKGDMLSAYLTKDIWTEGEMVLPKGTIIRGNASDVEHSKRLSKGAVLYVNFDHIVAPNGKQLPLKAGISADLKLTGDGGITNGGNYGTVFMERANKSKNIITKTTKWGITSGEELFTGGKYLVTPFAAVGGTVAGAGYLVGNSVADLFRKGKEVVINKGQNFEIMLLEPLDVPVF